MTADVTDDAAEARRLIKAYHDGMALFTTEVMADMSPTEFKAAWLPMNSGLAAAQVHAALALAAATERQYKVVERAARYVEEAAKTAERTAERLGRNAGTQ